jgi:hypothetical protein
LCFFFFSFRFPDSNFGVTTPFNFNFPTPDMPNSRDITNDLIVRK